MSSAEPGGDEGSAGKAPGPPAEEITDPALRAEVDNPAESNVPTGAEAAPGGEAAADPPLAAAGAPDELSSDQTPAQGREEGAPGPDEGLADVAGGDAGSPESGRSSGLAADVVPGPPTPAPTQVGATVPEQSASSAGAVGAGRAPGEEARAERADEAAAAEAAEAAASVPAEGEEPGTGEVDETRQDLVDRLGAALGGRLLGSHVVPGVDATVRVGIDDWHRAFEVCRDDLGLVYFDFISAIDWLPSPYGRSEDAGAEDAGAEVADDAALRMAPASGADLDHGTTGGATRFQLLARLVSPVSHLGLTLKADVEDEGPRAPTVSDVFAGADWHERETWEMYGIDFTGHPNQVHLYLPGEFEGYPQRKDFPLLAREVKPWPGLVDVEAMPGEPDAEAMPGEPDAEAS